MEGRKSAKVRVPRVHSGELLVIGRYCDCVRRRPPRITLITLITDPHGLARGKRHSAGLSCERSTTHTNNVQKQDFDPAHPTLDPARAHLSRRLKPRTDLDPRPPRCPTPHRTALAPGSGGSEPWNSSEPGLFPDRGSNGRGGHEVPSTQG